MSRPGSRVIPVGWEEHHQATAEGAFTATVELTDPDASSEVWNPAERRYDVTPAVPYYVGPGRAQQLNMPQVADVAGQPVSTHDYRVSISKSVAGVRIGHRVKVTAATDASLVGRTLTVTDVLRGSLTWQRDLICVDHN
jgi:hypothetical protein